ncbi:MAG TPA: NYN domain-containing protein [Candidatus Limnocylindria bacterium]|nr:NYN domain-containing protein [Candidatus Limnocylindria bacterium]
MSKNVAVFVDVANLYYSARGQEVDVDYVALLKAATKGRDLIRAYAYSGLDPENENQRKFIDFLFKNGYKVVHKDIRKFGDGRVKANLDIELVVDLFRLAKRMDIAVIVSGDGDFAPAIRALQDEGVRCEVISFRPNTSSDLIAVADEFIDIMKIASIGRGKKDGDAAAAKGMSAPPMPAKEVVPEFGFREASPSVAAAALAALREGKEPRGTGRGRGRGRGRADKADEAQPVEAAATVAPATNGDQPAADTEEGRRRRRRRGGRGRGRGGRAAETVAATPEQPGEIGWVELDDISQIEELTNAPLTDAGGEEREYTFEEADEATLAELGLLDAAGSTAEPAVEEPAEAVAAPSRRRTRTPKAASETAADEAPAKPARRSRARKAEATAAPAEDAAAAEEKPKAARRPRSTTAKAKAPAKEPAAKPSRRRTARSADATSPAEESAGDETQGIWKRFRTARGGGSTS